MTGKQCRVARALLAWSFEDLADRLQGKVSLRTLKAFEGDEAGGRKPETVAAIRAVFERAGIAFDDDGINVRLEPRKAKRKP